MREIKFRGLSKGKFIYGDIVRAILGGNIHFYIQPLDSKRVEVEMNTISQFTGLIDVNRYAIYEGDIVKYQGAIGNVSYDDITGMYVINFKLNRSVWSFNSIEEPVEVIGNIYQTKA